MARDGTKVLIIDDDSAITKMVVRILENGGFETCAADSVAAGLEVARSEIPHVILLDLKMPDEDGFAFLTQRSHIETISRIPTIVLSAVREKESVYRAISLGARDYLTKPVEAQLLVQKIKKTLKNEEYKCVEFSGDRPNVNAVLSGNIVMANEVGFILESGFRLAEDSPVGLSGEGVEAMGCGSCHFHRTRRPAKLSPEQLYYNDVAVVGITKETIKKIKGAVIE